MKCTYCEKEIKGETVKYEDLVNNFNVSIANIVDGVTKISNIKNKERKRLEAEARNKLFEIKSTWKNKLIKIEEKIKSLESSSSQWASSRKTINAPRWLSACSRTIRAIKVFS